MRSVGSPPKYMSPSRSRISLSPLAVNGVLLLFTEMVPVVGMEGVDKVKGCSDIRQDGDARDKSYWWIHNDESNALLFSMIKA